MGHGTFFPVFGHVGEVVANMADLRRRAAFVVARLDAAIERARGGRCVVLEVAGEPGMGKTSLLRAFTDRAASRQMSVLTGRASRFEQARPYGLFVDSITRADGLADLLAASSEEHGTLLCLDDDPSSIRPRLAAAHQRSADPPFARVSPPDAASLGKPLRLAHSDCRLTVVRVSGSRTVIEQPRD